MSDLGIVTESGAVRFERLLPGPIERVWAHLVESDKRGTWLASGEMQLQVGGRVRLQFRHADLSPRKEPTPERYAQYSDGVTTHGRITRLEPPHVLSYTWDESPQEASEVTFELTARGAKVLLVLTHRRLANEALMLDVASGWHTHLEILEAVLNGREPQPFWSAHARIEGEYARRLRER